MRYFKEELLQLSNKMKKEEEKEKEMKIKKRQEQEEKEKSYNHYFLYYGAVKNSENYIIASYSKSIIERKTKWYKSVPLPMENTHGKAFMAIIDYGLDFDGEIKEFTQPYSSLNSLKRGEKIGRLLKLAIANSKRFNIINDFEIEIIDENGRPDWHIFTGDSSFYIKCFQIKII